jgi:hypothetical protein
LSNPEGVEVVITEALVHCEPSRHNSRSQ